MILFKHTTENKYLITNYKVMFSTLVHQENLERVNYRSFVLYSILATIGLRKKAPIHFLLRDPELRLQSFFKNKFRQHIDKQSNSEWEHCQRIFFDQLGVAKSDSTKKIKDVILQFTYQDFILHLKDHYLKDAHLLPQTYKKNLSIGGISLPIKFKPDRVYLMEIEKDIQSLEQDFNLDLSQRKNRSHSEINQSEISKEMHKIVREVYKSDYDLYAKWS